jgi:hypothetical protein
MSNNIGIESNTTVSYGELINNNKLKTVSLTEIIHNIKTGNNGIKERIEEIRACTDPEKRRALKQGNLPYFNMGTFREDLRRDQNFEKTQYFILDADHLGDKVAEFKQKLTQDPTVYYAFTSPSGDGLKIIYKLESVVSDSADYKKIYKYYSDAFEKKYACTVDHTIDPSRACFLSYDTDMYVNEDALPLPMDVQHQTAVLPNAMKDELAQLLASGATPGNRTGIATQIIGHCISRGYTKDVTIEMVKMWNQQKNNPPLPDDKIVYTVEDMYARYQCTDSREMPLDVIEKSGSYYKVTYRNDKPVETMLTSFTLEPKVLLEFEDSDCLQCIVKSANGYTYSNVSIENTDWHSKSKLLHAIGHQDCTFHGSENDVQGLCSYVNSFVPIRKKGTKVVGLLPAEKMWVTEGLNITVSGISLDPTIISYDKGKNAFYHGIKYHQIDDADYTVLLSGLYSNITQLNEDNVIIPWLSWTLTAPVKPILLDYVGGFPLTFVHGPQGCGKTSTAKMLKRLSGYKDPKPHSCKEKPFPMLKLLSSTNAIPVFLDEYKEKLLTEDQMNNIKAYMNKAYSGEVETKGQADQTTRDYEILAPMCVMGEWNITLPSIFERVLVIRFKGTIKKDKKMQAVFDRVWKLPLEAFMPKYIEFCLQQNIPAMFEAAKQYVENLFNSLIVAPRIIDNLSVMVLGVELFKQFGMANKINVPSMNIDEVLKHQLKELSVMALKEKPMIDTFIKDGTTGALVPTQRDPNGYDVKIRNGADYKLVDGVKNVSRVLAINFKKIFDDFVIHARQIGFEGLLDKESYLRQFDETSYVIEKNHPVNFNGKSVRVLCIDIDKALSAGIDLEGFGIS